jgi:hypothetical protein
LGTESAERRVQPLDATAIVYMVPVFTQRAARGPRDCQWRL